MNTPGYKKAYMANLQTTINNNNKNLVKGNPSAQQYIKNTGQQVLGISPTTKLKGFK
jgi:hypothetical protein